MKNPDAFDALSNVEWKVDKKNSNKELMVFSRSQTLTINETYAQPWVEPKTFKKKHIHGKVKVTEYKYINKHNSEMSFKRVMEPCAEGCIIKDAL